MQISAATDFPSLLKYIFFGRIMVSLEHFRWLCFKKFLHIKCQKKYILILKTLEIFLKSFSKFEGSFRTKTEGNKKNKKCYFKLFNTKLFGNLQLASSRAPHIISFILCPRYATH